MADVGRALLQSGALDTVSDIQRRAFDVRRSEFEGAGDLVKQGMAIEEFQQGRETFALDKAKREGELAKVAKEDEFNAKVISMDAITAQFEKTLPGSSDMIRQSMTDFGLARDVNGVLTTTVGELKRGQELLEGNAELQGQLIDNSVTKLQQSIRGTQAEIAEEIEKNGPASPKLEKLGEKLTALIGVQSSVLEDAAKKQTTADIKDETVKPEMTKAQAFKRISSIGTARVRLIDGLESGSDTFLTLLPEDLQAQIKAGSIKAEDAVNTAIEQLDTEERFLREEFLGEAVKILTTEELVAAGAAEGSKASLDEGGNQELENGVPVYVDPDGNRFVVE